MADLPEHRVAVTEEWYPNECQFCTREAALACTDPHCRWVGYGKDRAGVPPGGDTEAEVS